MPVGSPLDELSVFLTGNCSVPLVALMCLGVYIRRSSSFGTMALVHFILPRSRAASARDRCNHRVLQKKKLVSVSWSLARGLQDTARDSGMLLWVMFLAMDGREPDMCRVAGRLCRALTDGDARSLGVLTRSFPPGLLAPCPPDQVQYGAGHLRLGVDPLSRTSEVFCFFGSCWCWCSGRSPPLTLEHA